MKLKYVLLIPMAVVLTAAAQDKPPTTPQLSVDSRLAIREAQLRQKQLEAQFLTKQQEVAGLQQQMTKLSDEYKEGGKTLQSAIDAAYVVAKLDKKEWTLDAEKLEFIAVPKPVTPPVAPKVAPVTAPAPK